MTYDFDVKLMLNSPTSLATTKVHRIVWFGACRIILAANWDGSNVRNKHWRGLREGERKRGNERGRRKERERLGRMPVGHQGLWNSIKALEALPSFKERNIYTHRERERE